MFGGEITLRPEFCSLVLTFRTDAEHGLESTGRAARLTPSLLQDRQQLYFHRSSFGLGEAMGCRRCHKTRAEGACTCHTCRSESDLKRLKLAKGRQSLQPSSSNGAAPAEPGSQSGLETASLPPHH